MLFEYGYPFCGQWLTNLNKPSALRKPSCAPPHKRSKITLLNSQRTDASLPISTVVTLDINHNSDDSIVQVFLCFVC